MCIRCRFGAVLICYPSRSWSHSAFSLPVITVHPCAPLLPSPCYYLVMFPSIIYPYELLGSFQGSSSRRSPCLVNLRQCYLVSSCVNRFVFLVLFYRSFAVEVYLFLLTSTVCSLLWAVFYSFLFVSFFLFCSFFSVLFYDFFDLSILFVSFICRTFPFKFPVPYFLEV